MKRTKYVVRVIFLLVVIWLLVDLSRKTDNNAQTVADFKFKMFQKVSTDSLDARQKIDLLLNETTNFVDGSSHVKEGIHNLILLLGLFVVVEIAFFILEKRNSLPRN